MDSKQLTAALLAALALTGCVSTPDRLDAGWTHVSHPLLGPPFGPSNEEDTLDVFEVRATWKRGRYFTEMGLGQQLADGGFYGDGFIFTSRVGVTLWSKQ
jgi:hypothetical protein